MLTYFGKAPRGGLSADGIGTLQAVRGYWEALRQAGSIPNRADVDPRGLSDCLEKVFLIERIAPGHARFRLAGMHLTDIMGMDVRGMPLTAMFTAEARARISEELEQVFATPSILEIGLEAERGVGRGALAGRMILLPLMGDRDEAGLALGCLTTQGSLGRVPRRFAVSGIVRELLQTARPRLQVVEPVAAAAPLRPTKVVQPRPWLRLVSSMD